MTDENTLLLWGEQGLVTSMMLDLHALPLQSGWQPLMVECVQAILPEIGSLCSVQAVVEPDFGNVGFGHPGAIIKFGFTSGVQRVLLVEAKRGRYQASCKRAAERGQKGFNSKMNGQFELNHCLALALSAFREGYAALREDEWILDSPYSTERNSPLRGKNAGKLRCLKNRVVINHVVRGLCSLPVEAYFHLGITTDHMNPLEDPRSEAFLPELYSASCPSRNCWAEVKGRFLWTSWSKIEHHLHAAYPEGEGRESHFLQTIVKARENFIFATGSLPPIRYRSRERGYKSSSLIYAPAINPRTFVHFSWEGNGTAIRDYSRNSIQEPIPDRSRTTEEVEAEIRAEYRIKRTPYTDVAFWHSKTIELNGTALAGLLADEIEDPE